MSVARFRPWAPLIFQYSQWLERARADIIAGGRLQLGISRGSPEQVIDGQGYFGETDADMARRHAEGLLGRPGVVGLPF